MRSWDYCLQLLRSGAGLWPIGLQPAARVAIDGTGPRRRWSWPWRHSAGRFAVRHVRRRGRSLRRWTRHDAWAAVAVLRPMVQWDRAVLAGLAMRFRCRRLMAIGRRGCNGPCGPDGGCGCKAVRAMVRAPAVVPKAASAAVARTAATADGGDVQQAGFHHGLFGGRGCMRPGSTEAYADGGGGMGMATSQIAFLGDEGVQVSWDVSGSGMFDSTPLVIPGRQDFYQGAIYRLKLTNIPGRPGVELYPTLEVAPVTPRTDAYLAHSPIPVQFTEEDFDQVLSGNFVTKVIYLPDPEFQELALAGVETLVSTRLDPGVDPIAEADRRGSILAILRMGNKDLRAERRCDGRVRRRSCRRSHEGSRLDDASVGDAGDVQRSGWRVPTSRRIRCVASAVLRRWLRRRWLHDGGTAVTGGGGGDGQHADGHADRWLRSAGCAAEHDRRRTAMGHADHRHADRPAWSAARSAGRAGRFAEARDEEPHAGHDAAAGRQDAHVGQAAPGLELSAAGEPRPRRRNATRAVPACCRVG